jgi:hypothetical protein
MTSVTGQDGGSSGFTPEDPFGVWGDSARGDGVVGTSRGDNGVYGYSEDGSGVNGLSAHGSGVSGHSFDNGVGVEGSGFGGIGVKGTGSIGIYDIPATGVEGVSSSGPFEGSVGVRGICTREGAYEGASAGTGVVGTSDGGTGVYGYSEDGSGVVGNSAAGAAGTFLGDVRVTGRLETSAGGFRVDHPLDPENKYLAHSFVESLDMKTVYDGVVVLDETGVAWVELPQWFEALNRDYRYQLTAIGAPAPRLHITEEISDSRFRVAGGEPGMKVSWQVTGIRKDKWAEANPLRVEQEKAAGERGRYQHPELHGESIEKSLDLPLHEEQRRTRERMEGYRAEPTAPARRHEERLRQLAEKAQRIGWQEPEVPES